MTESKPTKIDFSHIEGHREVSPDEIPGYHAAPLREVKKPKIDFSHIPGHIEYENPEPAEKTESAKPEAVAAPKPTVLPSGKREPVKVAPMKGSAQINRRVHQILAHEKGKPFDVSTTVQNLAHEQSVRDETATSEPLPHDLRFEPIKSSHLRAAAFTLRGTYIMFSNGDIYRYPTLSFNQGRSSYSGLMDAAANGTAGQYFQTRIKPEHRGIQQTKG